jgi:hypothetical protein
MKKLFTSMFLMLILLTMTAGTALAQGTTTITGTVQTVTLETAPTGETIVVVTLLDETAGTTQTVKISLDTAKSLGLATTDPTTGKSTVAVDSVGTVIGIDSTTVLPQANTTVALHPVGSALSDFFSGLLGVDYEKIMSYHKDGVGFGVIAQALWLTNELRGDTVAFETLLQAKQSGDYSAITLADGSTPDNWGDVVKSLKKGDNLGSVMSTKGQSNQDTSGVMTDPSGNGHGNSNSHGSNQEKGNGNNKGNNQNGHGNSGGRP